MNNATMEQATEREAVKEYLQQYHVARKKKRILEERHRVLARELQAPAPGSAYSLVGCTVAPGFDFSDLCLGSRVELESRYPLALDCIREFCPPDDVQTPQIGHVAGASGDGSGPWAKGGCS